MVNTSFVVVRTIDDFSVFSDIQIAGISSSYPQSGNNFLFAF